MFLMSDRWSLIGRGSYMDFPSYGDDKVPSQDHNPSTHITPTTRERHHQDRYLPAQCENPRPTDRSISDWLRVVNYRASSTQGR